MDSFGLKRHFTKAVTTCLAASCPISTGRLGGVLAIRVTSTFGRQNRVSSIRLCLDGAG